MNLSSIWQDVLPSAPLASTASAAEGIRPPALLAHQGKPPQAFPGPRTDIASFVSVIRDLIEREQIAIARRTLEATPIGLSEDPAMRRLRRVLAMPTTRAIARSDVDRGRAYEWLRQHGHQHRGRWVAVGEDGLLAAATTLRELRERLRASAPAVAPLIHKL
jgi:hypothetical protein